jgi:hypothetical protein
MLAENLIRSSDLNLELNLGGKRVLGKFESGGSMLRHNGQIVGTAQLIRLPGGLSKRGKKLPNYKILINLTSKQINGKLHMRGFCWGHYRSFVGSIQQAF